MNPLPAPEREPADVLVRWRITVGFLAAVIAVLLGAIVWMIVPKAARASGATRGGAVSAGIQPVLCISGPGTGPNPQFDRPLSAAFASDGDIVVADTGHNRVCVFGPDGAFKFEFGGLGVTKPLPGGRYTWQPGLLNYPSGVAVDGAGDIYVADLRNNQVQVFDSAGRYLRRFPDPSTVVGKGGSGYDGKGLAATDVAVGGGHVYVADTYQVVEFDTAGTVISQWGKPGRGPADFDHPDGVAVSGSRMAVSDSDNVRVLGFSLEGAPQWGSDSVAASPGLALGLPRGLTAYGSGWIVADAIGQGLVQLDDTGRILARFGTRGVAPGEFNFPTDVDARAGELLVTDKENDRVQVVKIVGEGR